MENGRTIALGRQRPLPRHQEWIARFHRLQKLPCTDTFRAPFKR
jgi:hypothetical protein